MQLSRQLACLLVTLLCGILSLSVAAEPDTHIPDFYKEPGVSATRNYAGTDTEVIDPFSGSLQLIYNDIGITGNGEAGASVVRVYSPFNAVKGFGVGYQLRGRTVTGVGWDIHFGRVWQFDQFSGENCQSNMVHVGKNPVLELPSGSRQVFANAPSGAAYDLISKDRWIASCTITRRTENGTIYNESGLLVTAPNGTRYTIDRLSRVHESLNESSALHVTRIEDRNGNWVEINYQPRNINPATIINEVVGSDGGKIEFTYSDPTSSKALLTEIKVGSQKWRYLYNKVPNIATEHYFLEEVQGPEGLRWKYEYYPPSSTYAYLIKKVTTPYGGSSSYEYQHVRFESDVQAPSLAVKKKTTSGPGIKSGTWNYQFSPSSSYDETIVTTPVSKEIYRHYGMRSSKSGSLWKIGLPISKETLSLQNKSLRKEVYTAWDTQFISSQNDYRPSIASIDENISSPILLEKTITQDGNTYRTQYLDHTAYGAPQKKLEFGQVNRETTTLYSNNLNKWILSQPVKETVTGVGSTERSYDANGNLNWVKQFGITTGQYTYYNNGTTKTVKNANGHITTFSNYKRGIARQENQPENVTISREVDDYGNITSLTDGRSKTTTYRYDQLNRITAITPPIKSAISVSYSLSSRTQTLTRGAFRDSLTFDGFGRKLQRTATDTLLSKTITTTNKYDELGRQVFTSHPNQSLLGVTTVYDALGRVLTTTLPGNRINQIEYLVNNQARLTNPKGAVTLQTYRSFGEPNEKQLVKIEQPEGVTTTMQLNLLGQPLVVTQGGITRSYEYNQHYQLISETHPEQGVTRFNRDNLNNVIQKSTDGHYQKLAYSYDALNRLRKVYSYEWDRIVDTGNYDFDENGNLTNFSKSEVSRSYQYDSNNNLINESLVVADRRFEIKYAYNQLDALSSITYPSANDVVNQSCTTQLSYFS
ncbi:hypothetical protein [Alkalimarinus coralli]|uniref:hypothetical protein n=1 Tax=Alkalimarinus coralli TaxID=2935863 RepID=UPI00202B793B|nr:hypothetical protein [Alkalimarinus coralli]